MKIFIQFIFYNIYKFYNRFWPNHDPELYAYFGTVWLISMNFISAFFFSLLLIDSNIDEGPYIHIFFFLLSLFINYNLFLKGRKYINLNSNNFKSIIYKDWYGLSLFFIYIFLSFFVYLYLANTLRQFHINN